MKPAYDFSGKVALVTCAAQGIGFAAAKGFAVAGAAVVLSDRDEDRRREATRDLETTGSRVVGIACDVSDEARAQELVARTVAEFGRFDMA